MVRLAGRGTTRKAQVLPQEKAQLTRVTEKQVLRKDKRPVVKEATSSLSGKLSHVGNT